MMVNWKYSFSIPFYYIIWHFLPSQNFKSEFWIFIIVDFSLQFFDYYSVKTYKSSSHTTTMWCVPMNSIKTMLSQNVYLIIILAFSVIRIKLSCMVNAYFQTIGHLKSILLKCVQHLLLCFSSAYFIYFEIIST